MSKINLTKTSPDAPKNAEKEAIEAETRALTKHIGELQDLLKADGKKSVLVVLQGMDGSGKDGAVENVFSKCTASGLTVKGWKKPSDEEFAHDFLWRIHKEAPARGEIKIFVRSHYEDILIQRVHGWIDMARVEKRMAAINAWEELLAFDAGTLVLKFFLHISEKDQADELQQRIDDPAKHWKHNAADWEERKLWPKYMEAYEYILEKSAIPWTIVGVDNRWWRDYVIAKKVVEEMEKMALEYPPLREK